MKLLFTIALAVLIQVHTTLDQVRLLNCEEILNVKHGKGHTRVLMKHEFDAVEITETDLYVKEECKLSEKGEEL